MPACLPRLAACLAVCLAAALLASFLPTCLLLDHGLPACLALAGVTRDQPDPSLPFRAHIQLPRGKYKYLGSFATAKEAALAYDR